MFARTDRLLLRPGWPEDAPVLAAQIGDEAIVRNLTHAPWPYRLEDATAFLARGRDPRHPAVLIFARTLGSPRLVGCIGLEPSGRGDAQLGYWIGRAYWGLGYATEAGRAMIALARQSLRVGRLVARHFADNPASGQVLRKLGFHASGEDRPLVGAARRVPALSIGYALDLVDLAGLRALAA